MTLEQYYHLRMNIIRDTVLFALLLLMLIPVPAVSWTVYLVTFVLTGYGFVEIVINYQELKAESIRQRHESSWYIVAWNTAITIATLAVIIMAPLPPLAISILGGLYLSTAILAAPFSFPDNDIK